ncbi:MAG: hypothetical protein WCI11_04325 [Candidatus Methylumidiphilus sp.]
MNSIDQLRFAISDRINDGEISPSHITLMLLGEFQKDVSDFLKGSNRDVDPSKVLVSIEEGSLAFVATGLLAASTLWADLEHLKSADSLNSIDSKRAIVVERWQSLAQKNPHRRYSVVNQLSQILFKVDSTSNFCKEDSWVQVEKYLHGIVFDIGGNTKANVHIKLENGETLPPIASTHDYLEKYGQDRLYRPALLHVTAEENLLTKELRNLSLLAFESHQPSYDDYEFNIMVERGSKAWSEVINSSAWLDDLRGSRA